MSLPQQLPLSAMQTTWATQLEPLLSFPPNNGLLIKNLALVTGANSINHKLQRLPQGWMIIDQNAVATFYRSQPLNNLTLTLTSSATVTVSLWVF